MTTNTVSQKSNLDAALEYAKEGWPVLPLIGKRPLTEHGVKDATRDVGKITEWWTRYPEANIGLATGRDSGRLVLDIDVKKGKRGEESLRALEEEYGALPRTRQSITASGGSHYLFRMTGDKVKSRNAVRDGIDLLVDGKYFVAPPSVVEGKAYQWIDMTEPALCPPWVDALGNQKRAIAVPLENKIPAIIRELFPEGFESNGYWMGRCPYHNDIDPSLSITLENGDFRCFSCPDVKGTLIQLYAKVKGVSEDEARDILVPVPDYVKRLNERHAVISLAGKVQILNEEYDLFGNYIGVTFSSASDLVLRYRNQTIPGWKKKPISIAEAWLEHPRRREYQRLIFEPGLPQEPGSYNLWKGFTVSSENGSNCDLYLSHLHDNICQGNQRLYDYLIAWMADAVQRPRSRQAWLLCCVVDKERASQLLAKSSENCSAIIF